MVPYKISNGFGLITLMANENVGHHIDGVSLNHAGYAVDMVVLVPSAKALQELVDTCHEHAESHDITFNATRTVRMNFMPGKNTLQLDQSKMGIVPLSFIE